jgi:N-acetylglucosamine-6-sulfatase
VDQIATLFKDCSRWERRTGRLERNFRMGIKIRFLVCLLCILGTGFSLSACGTKKPYPDWTPEINFQPPGEYQVTIFEAENPAPASEARLADPRPNIIFVLTDDQPPHTVAYMPTVKNVLMAEGVNFENGFLTTPLCCPSRASLLSGQYVHNHKVYTNRYPLGGAKKFDDVSTVAVWLREAGYRTGYFGKYLNDYDDLEPYGVVPPGWTDWAVFLARDIGDEDKGNLQYFFDFIMSENGEAVEYPKKKYNFSADVVTNKAVNFVNEAREEPFLLFVSYYNPHSPYVWAPRHEETFRQGWAWEQYRPPSFNEVNISDKPDYIAELKPFSPEEVDITYRQILRSLLSVDDGIASLLKVLEQTGLDDKTIIVFLTDNGLTAGDHRFGFSKNCPYEACIKTPFIVYAPWKYPARTDLSLVANIDLAPTFADLAGASIPDTVDGMSLVPLLESGYTPWRDALLLEHWPTEEGVGAIIPEFYSVRTIEWKYTEYVTGECELYDLINDPYELDNLANQGRYRDIQSELQERLVDLKKD